MQTLAEAAWEHWAAHAPKTWHCPLCEFVAIWSPARVDGIPPSIARHAAERHPAYLPEKQTVAEMLDAIPVLVREAWLTVDAPNPDGPRVGSRGGPSRDELVLSVTQPEPDSPTWTRSPRRVSLARALSTALESSLFAPVLECSRLVWESLDDDTKRAHPQPIGEPTWQAEVSWLRKTWQDAQAYLDQADFAWIESEVRGVWRSLAAMAGVRPRPRNLCPDCRAPMHLDDSDWQTCDAGHQHPGPRRLERQWRRKAPMSTRRICEELRVPRRTLMSWQEAGRIKPTSTEGKSSLWLPWDVIALRYPDIVASIDKRDDVA